MLHNKGFLAIMRAVSLNETLFHFVEISLVEADIFTEDMSRD